jgi:hypothetical protein
MIQAVGLDEQTNELEVVFTSGKIYRYKGVPKTIYEQLLVADSKGAFMKSFIIGMYPEYKVSRRRV